MGPQGGSAAAQAMQQFQQMQQQRAQQPGQGSQIPQGGSGPFDQLQQQWEAQMNGGQQAAPQQNQLLGHPAVQQALQNIGSFLGKIGHPLAGVFGQMHPIQQAPGANGGQ